MLVSLSCFGDDDRPVARIENDRVEVVVDLGGGSLTAYRLKPDGLNPLQWDSWSFNAKADETPPMTPRSMGHFLCLDRWGPPSDAERARGLKNHGEATKVWWEEAPDSKGAQGVLNLRATLPLADLSVERVVRMEPGSTLVQVEERVTNVNPIGRIYNLVQHPTIGPPFLDRETIVDSNGTRGFMQERPMPNPESPEVRWPNSLTLDGTESDLRYFTYDQKPAVVSFIIEEEYGWVTAASPSSGLLLGYLWKSADHPWLNIWRHLKDGEPFARGLEFGTTGLHRPGHDLVAKGRIFDRSLYRYIDPDETQTFRFAMFLVEIPDDFAGVSSLEYADESIRILERGPRARPIEVEAYSLF